MKSGQWWENETGHGVWAKKSKWGVGRRGGNLARTIHSASSQIPPVSELGCSFPLGVRRSRLIGGSYFLLQKQVRRSSVPTTFKFLLLKIVSLPSSCILGWHILNCIIAERRTVRGLNFIFKPMNSFGIWKETSTVPVPGSGTITRMIS